MNKINRIKKNVEQIEKLLSEVKKELEALKEVMNKKSSKSENSTIKSEKLPSEDELKQEYEKLYEEFIKGNLTAVQEFIKGKTKKYLKFFCKANNLPIDTTKTSKDRIVEKVIQWLAQRKAITQKPMIRKNNK